MFLFAGVAQAQTDNLFEPGMLPDSPFYFLKSWSETIGTLLTFSDIAKAERFVNLSEKRLAEANALVAKSKPEIAEKAVLRYQDQLGAALTKVAEAKAKVAESTLKHQAVLADVYEKVPEQAKSAIKHAIEASIRGHEETLKAVSNQRREEILEKMIPARSETPGRPQETPHRSARAVETLRGCEGWDRTIIDGFKGRCPTLRRPRNVLQSYHSRPQKFNLINSWFCVKI